ncbi:MAG: methyltransferase domain-containing protein [Candidatus Poribacteria bacterium]
MRIIRLISSITPRGADVLDVGCGAGHIAAMLSSIGFNAIGFDLSIKNTNRVWIPLKARYGSQYMVADARKLPFGDETFNVIIAFAVLEHIGGNSEEEMFLKECNRVLKRKGFFVISGLPTKYALNEILGRCVGDAHNRRYSKKQIAEKLMASGLRLIYLRYDHFLPRYIPINFLNKLWNRLAPVIHIVDEKLAILPLSDSFIIVSVKGTLVPRGDTLEEL